MLKILDYVIVIFMFVGVGIAVEFLGWPTMHQYTNWGLPLPITYVLLVYFLIRWDRTACLKDFNYNFYILAFVFILVYRYLIGDGLGWGKLLATIVTPLLAMFWTHDMLLRGNKEKVKLLFLIMFVISIIIAIYEKTYHTLLFPYSNFNEDDINGTIHGDYLRSNSVWGHPLTNAFAVSVVMIFILISDLNYLYKWILYVGGFVSLMCFGARAAVFFSIAFGVISLFVFNEKKRKIKDFIIRLIFLFLLLFILFLVSKKITFTDRLINETVDANDNSTLARIDAFQYMINIDSSALFRGIGQDEFLLTHNHIENWILMFIMFYGLLITVFVVFYFCKICWYGLKNYSLQQKLCLLGVFATVSLSNNSLAVASPAFPIFFLCCAIFEPELTKNKNRQFDNIINLKKNE